MRDTKWLVERTYFILKRYFPDIKLGNNLVVKFGRPSRTRLGSIKYGRRDKANPNTIITLNGHFKNKEIPDFIVDATLAHELTHYAHGFFSPRQRLHHYPHHGGVVRKEMLDRGLANMLQLQKRWLKENWVEFLKKRE